MISSYIEVVHNFEAAHRLYEMPGKCQRIHGHSFLATLRLYGELDKHGVLINNMSDQLDFGTVKATYRHYLDTNYDHALLLNSADKLVDLWTNALVMDEAAKLDIVAEHGLPGLMVMPGDPTTENLALWIAKWALNEYAVCSVAVHVQETAVNNAGIALSS